MAIVQFQQIYGSVCVCVCVAREKWDAFVEVRWMRDKQTSKCFVASNNKVNSSYFCFAIWNMSQMGLAILPASISICQNNKWTFLKTLHLCPMCETRCVLCCDIRSHIIRNSVPWLMLMLLLRCGCKRLLVSLYNLLLFGKTCHQH